MSGPAFGSVFAERLADASGFETYRFVSAEDEAPIAVVALRPRAGSVEYALWRDGMDALDPFTTGALGADEGTWDDSARERALRQVAYDHEEDLRFSGDDLEVLLGEPAEDEEEDLEDEDLEDDEDED